VHRLAAAAVVVLLTGACAERPSPSSSPQPSPSITSESPGDLPGALCENSQAGTAENFPRFEEVELESEDGVDRITFLFDPDDGAPDRPPLHFLTFTDELITEGEGAPVEARGEYFAVISFQAVGVDLSGSKPVEVYTGPKRFRPGYETLLDVVHLGDFEGQVSWGLGLSRRACVRIDGQQDRLTLEFASA
jgi:hypothetical protein